MWSFDLRTWECLGCRAWKRREVLKRAFEALAPAAPLGSAKASTSQTVNPNS